MPYIDLAAVKAAIEVPALLADMGYRPYLRSGRGWRGGCPVQASRLDTSSSLYSESQWWYCHHCKRGGDVIDLWAAVHRVIFVEALRQLAERYCGEVPASPSRRGKGPRGPWRNR